MEILREHVDGKAWNVETTEKWLHTSWQKHQWLTKDPNQLFELFASMMICYEFSLSKQLLKDIQEIDRFIFEHFEKKISRIHPILLARTAYLCKKHGIEQNRVIKKGIDILKERLKKIKVNNKIDAKLLLLLKLFDVLPKQQIIELCEEKIIADSECILLNEEEMIQQVYLWFTLLSFGEEKMPERLSMLSNTLKTSFTGYMLAACQEYQLIVVSLILRAMIYLDYESTYIADGLEFISFQQRSDGSFGFINPVMRENMEQLENAELSYHLPITHEILWVFLAGTREGG